MPIAAGAHALGPAQGTLQVNTFREGVAARVGHDLIIDVTDWQASVTVAEGGALSAVELSASPSSLAVREGLRGVKPLSDGDRADIRKTIDERVLARKPISFRSSAVEGGAGGAFTVRGDLTLGGTTRPTSFALTVGDDGHVVGRAEVRQSDWGIKPYRGLMGALRVSRRGRGRDRRAPVAGIAGVRYVGLVTRAVIVAAALAAGGAALAGVPASAAPRP